MENLENLYREIILEHYRNPRNKGLLSDPSFVTVRVKNPSCGDDITVQAKIADGKVADCRHEGKGCSICCSSASVMSETLIGKTVEEARKVADNYLLLVTGKNPDPSVDLGEAEVYAGVRQFPARVKCASIAWTAFEQALDKK